MSYRRSINLFCMVLLIVVLLLVNLPASITSTYAYNPEPGMIASGQAPLSISFPKEVNSLSALIPPELPIAAVTQQQIETISGVLSAEKTTIGVEGGAASFLSEQLLLLVNRSLLATDQTLQVYETDLADASTAPEGGLLRFQVDSEGIFTEVVSQPVYMAFDMRSYDIGERDWFVVRRSDENASIWEYLPVDVYDATGLFNVRNDYLTGDIIVGAYGYQPEGMAMMMSIGGGEIDSDPAPWRYQWTLPTVSAFSGAATYSYPIEVPPGRNGLQPNIDISYSSRGVDGPIVSDGQDQGPLGLGWNINNIEITRSDMDLTHNGDGCIVELPDNFSLVLGGQSHRLEPYGDPGHYQAVNNPGIRVRMIQDLNATDINSDGVYWTVETPNGTTYRLGYNEEAETGLRVQWGTFNHQGNGHQYSGIRDKYTTFRWRVDTSTDVYGNQVQYSYEEWEEADSDSCGDTNLYATNARMKEIRYNFINLAPDANTGVTGNYASLIKFELNGAHRVEQIKLFHSDLVNPYRVIDIGLGQAGGNNFTCAHGEWDSITQLVTYIRQESGDELYRLPKTEFGYMPQLHGTKSGEIHPTDPTQNCWQYQYLQTVENGYGGSMQFNYQGDGRASYPYIWFDWDGDGDLDYVQSNVPDYGQSYVVTSVYAWDGMHGGVPTVVDYTYDAPCYDQNDGDRGDFTNTSNCATPGQTGHGNLVGFNSTTQTHYAYGTSAQIRGAVINKSRTVFSQNTATNLGQPLEQYAYNNNDLLLNKVEILYQSEAVNGVGNAFTYAHTSTSTQYDNGAGSTELSTKTIYSYDPALQGGKQYGNLTNIELYKDADDSIPYKTTRRTYYPNESAWLVSLLGVEGAYEGNNTDNLLTGTWYYYDDATLPQTPPVKGELTQVDLIASDPAGCATIPNCAQRRQFIRTAYNYDSFGNQTTEVNYREYGYRAFNASWGIIENTTLAELTATEPVTTTISYDEQYHLYPVKVTNTLGHETKFEVYGFEDHNQQIVPLDGFQTVPGLLKRIADPNNVESVYEYDPFGRLYATYEREIYQGTLTNPLDGQPVNRYLYFDNSWLNGWQPNMVGVHTSPPTQPFVIVNYTRPDSNLGYELKNLTYYDGFGRPIQTQDRSFNVASESGEIESDIVTTTEYDALGQVVCSTSPYSYSPPYSQRGGSTGYISTPCDDASLASTDSAYDALGRPLSITAPDGTHTSFEYRIHDVVTVDEFNHLAMTKVTDANGHQTAQFTNSLGNLVLVREYDEVAGVASGDTDTRYKYDLLGNLERVITTEASQEQTLNLVEFAPRQVFMDYDGFGRKIYMNDPDMGTWTYEYDVVGNLTEQLDAKDNRVCYYYDELNRLVNKGAIENGATTDCPEQFSQEDTGWLASYVYDLYQYGIGNLSEVYWAGFNGNTDAEIYEYDEFGRPIRQTRIINRRPFTQRTLSFDLLNRPLSIEYPDGSITNMEYDRQGANGLDLTIAGQTTPLVTDIHHNGQGQIMSLTRGNGNSTQYNYYPASGTNGNGNSRLKSIDHGSELFKYAYTYDPVGNIHSIEEVRPTAETQVFEYDYLNRLTKVTGPYSLDYGYDLLGNITNVTNAEGSINYFYSGTGGPHAVNRLVDTQTNAEVGAFTYDFNGNMITRTEGAETYNQLFDVENRLISVEKNGETTQFLYDASGQRTMMIQDGGLSITYYPFGTYEETIVLDSLAISDAPEYVSDADNSLTNVTVSANSGPEETTSRSDDLDSTPAVATLLETIFDGYRPPVSKSINASPAQAPTTVIVDNTNSSQVSVVGSWSASSYSSDRYGSNYLHNQADGNGGKRVTFTPNIPATYVYEVFVMYNSDGVSRWNAIPVDIVYAGGSKTVTLNQSNANLSGQWVSLGKYPFYQGQGGSVVIRSTGVPNGKYIIADAVRFVPVADPYPSVPKANAIVLDNTNTSRVTVNGFWTTSIYNTDYYNINYLHDNNSNKGSSEVIYRPNISSEGMYEVYVIWNSDTSRASNVPITIKSANGAETIYVNQRNQGGQWVSLGRHYFNSGTTGYVKISNAGTNGYVIADAVAFAPASGSSVSTKPANSTVVDNTSSNVTKTGNWIVSSYANGYYGVNYFHDDNSNKGSNTLTFSLPIASSGTYGLYMIWPSASESSSNTPVTIYSTNGTTQLTINQQVNGGQWVYLGRFAMDAGSAKVVIGNAGTDGYVRADAVAFAPAPGTPANPTPPSGSIVMDNTAAGVTKTSGWATSDYADGYYHTNYFHDRNDQQFTQIVRYNPVLPHDGSYALYMLWPAGPAYSTKTQVTLQTANGPKYLTVNQQENGSEWVYLGRFSFEMASAQVSISNVGADGYVIADAIALQPAPGTGSQTKPTPDSIVVDNTSSAADPDAGWIISDYADGFFGSNYLTDGNGSRGELQITYTPNLPISGRYEVYLIWTGEMLRASNVPVTVHHAAGSATFSLDQRQQGGQWLLLGSFPFDAGSSGFVVIENDGADGFVIADAVAFAPVPGEVTPLYPGGAVVDTSLPAGATQIKRSTYALAGQTIAINVSGDPTSTNNGLFYVYSDHLGSTTALTNSSGDPIGEPTRYLPFGGYRGTVPTQTITDQGFTGHKHNDDIGLIYMNARYYVPYINRFASADTIVPNTEDPQSLNRYAYTRNNPLKFIDPSGHCWGIFSGLRNTFYSTTCENIDQALTIVQHPDATVGEKIVAGGYVLVEGVAHACVALCVPGAYAVESAAVTTTAASAGTAACADGDCTNEVVAAANGVSNTANAIMADGQPTNELELGLNTFSKAAQYGIDTYRRLRNAVSGTGLQVHHIVEKRFASTLGIQNTNSMFSVALTPEEHQVFTNAWRSLVPYGTDYTSLTKEQIWTYAQSIYMEYPELLEAARQTIFGQ